MDGAHRIVNVLSGYSTCMLSASCFVGTNTYIIYRCMLQLIGVFSTSLGGQQNKKRVRL